MKKLGFGCMRLPMKDGNVDLEHFSKMIKAYMAHGFNYFDTAHGYIQERSEKAIKTCLTSVYPRESYILTNKLTGYYFNKEEDIIPLFESQLQICGVEYFDYYLMHAQNAKEFKKFKKCRAYEQALELKKQGRIKHLGISFHDKATVLDQILTEYPQIEVVQIQFNYVDYDSPSIESKKLYEVVRKHQKEIMIMEPVKGGSLVNLPMIAQKVLDDLHQDYSNAAYALRFAGSFEGVIMVLSGMSNMRQMEENIKLFDDFKPLSPKEFEAIYMVSALFNSQKLIPCTACAYCVAGCPKKIAIPELFACMNQKNHYKDWNSEYYYGVHTQNNGKASECIACGKCEQICPQHLKIRDLLKDVATTFETIPAHDGKD